MKLNKYLPFACFYFFLNTLGLPFGLTYTTVFSPLIYLWVVSTRKKEILWPFLVVATPFVLIQIVYGVQMQTYIPAFINATSVYIFCQALYTVLTHCKDLQGIFRTLLIINFIFCLVGIPLYFTPYHDVLWINQFLTPGVEDFRRFRLFAYEASIYATQFTPLFFYFYMRSALGISKTSFPLVLLFIGLPLLLAFSFGVITAIVLALLLEGCILFRYLSRKKPFWRLALIAVIVLVAGTGLFIILFPQNVLFHRLDNILAGKDNSGNGRTGNAFVLAEKILELKNRLFGIGPGQLKLIGTGIIKAFYNYPEDSTLIAIPNTTAETMLVYGYLGLGLKFAAEIFLFIRTRVWTNYYRLALFLFVFIYQFTGSFVTNLAEYVIWILAFTNCFPEFDVLPKKIQPHQSDINEKIDYPQGA